MRNISIVTPHNAAGITSLGRTINIAGVITVFHCAATFIFPNNAANIITTDITSIVTVSYLGRNRSGHFIIGVSGKSFDVILSYNATNKAGTIADASTDFIGIAAIFNDATKVTSHNATDSYPLDITSIVAVGDRPSVLSGNSTDRESAIDATIDGEILHTALSSLFIHYCANNAKKATVDICGIVDIEAADRVVLTIKGADVWIVSITDRRPGTILFAAKINIIHQLRVGRWLCSFVVCAIDEIAKGCEIFCIVD